MHSVAAPPPTQSPPDTTGSPVPLPIVLIAGEWWQFMAGCMCTLYFVSYKGIIMVVLLLLIVTVSIVVAVVIVKRKQRGEISIS